MRARSKENHVTLVESTTAVHIFLVSNDKDEGVSMSNYILGMDHAIFFVIIDIAFHRDRSDISIILL